MASDSGRELPSPERVLTSLKSSGIFDEFRKSCMASVELEVSYLFWEYRSSRWVNSSLLPTPEGEVDIVRERTGWVVCRDQRVLICTHSIATLFVPSVVLIH